MGEGKTFLTVPQVADLIGVSVPRCYQLVSEGRLPHVRRGRRILVPRAAWERWMATQTDRALAAAAPRD